MSDREIRLGELAERVADLEDLGDERISLSDVDSECESWLTENFRMLAAIGSLGPGELGFGSDGPPQLWGPLRVLDALESDASGELYEAHDAAHDRRQWLRLMPPTALAPSRGRVDLEHEAQVLFGIDDPRLARVRGAAAYEGRRGIWCEAVEGEWLSHRSAEPMEWGQACDLTTELAELLGTLHEHGLIHRRIERSRIVLTHDGPVFVDLGGLGVGDASIRAPEVLLGAAPTVRSDVYSLGLLFCELVGIEADVMTGPLAFLVEPEPDRRVRTMAEAADVLRTAHASPQRPGARSWLDFFRRRRG